MPDNVKGITVLKDYLNGLKMLSDEQRGRLFLALFADSGCCDMPEMDVMTRMVFELVIPSIRMFQDSYARQTAARAENGRKGGRPRKIIKQKDETEKPIGCQDNRTDNLKNEDETEKAELNRYEEKRTDENGEDKEESVSHTQHKSSSSEDKSLFGEYGQVKLLQDEYVKLCEKFGKDKTDEAIRFLDLHIQSKGIDAYSDHCAAIQKWVFSAVMERNAKDRRNAPEPTLTLINPRRKRDA